MSLSAVQPLHDRIAELEAALARRSSRELRFALAEAFRLSPSEAAILARLYEAKGKPVRRAELDGLVFRKDHAKPTTNVLAVLIAYLRRKLERDAIEAGAGTYALTPSGLALCAEGLETLESNLA